MAKIFEEIKTPEELLAYMSANSGYGYIGKNNQRLYTHKDLDIAADFEKEYYLQTPEEFLISKHGVCWDSAELARHWFSKQAFEFKVFFAIFIKETKNNLPTHTFLTYKNNNKWHWFECAFRRHKGIHEFKSLNDLIEDVKRKQSAYVINDCGAEADVYECLKIYEYEKPTYHCDAEEFVMNIVTKTQEYKF